MHPYGSGRARTASRKSAQTTISAARAAAEAAFMVRPEPATPAAAPARPVLVLHRKARPPLAHIAPQHPAAPEVGVLALAAPGSALREARVFRLPEADPATAVAPELAESAPEPSFVPRAERVGHDRRAGELMVVKPESRPELAPEVAHEPERDEAPAMSVAPVTPAMVSAQLQALADLAPTFKLVAQAQAFNLEVAACRADWERLAAAADAVGRELALSLDKQPAPVRSFMP